MITNGLNFTETQRKAAIYGLYQIARSDFEFDDTEIDFLKKIGESLGEVFDHMSISNLIVENASSQINSLKTFNKKQKEWFVVASYSMINSDNKLFDEEFNVANGLFKAMGISQEKAVSLISNLGNGVNYY